MGYVQYNGVALI